MDVACAMEGFCIFAGAAEGKVIDTFSGWGGLVGGRAAGYGLGLGTGCRWRYAGAATARRCPWWRWGQASDRLILIMGLGASLDTVFVGYQLTGCF